MELEAENWRLCSTTLVRGVAVELEAENWRVSSTTLVRAANAHDDELGCHRLAAGGVFGRHARYFLHSNTGRELNSESTLNIYSACCVSPHATLSRFSWTQSFRQ